jgi:hypothetical protein
MSKKSERISNIIGCRNAINHQVKIGQDGICSYDPLLIKKILATLEATLKLDGITGIPADAKVGKK